MLVIDEKDIYGINKIRRIDHNVRMIKYWI